MKTKYILNGKVVPYHQSFSELIEMLKASDITDFALACQVLTASKTKESYDLLKQYLYDPSKYKRRFVWSIIFEFPDASELMDYFVDNFYSHDSMFVITAFDVAIKYHLPIAESVIWDAVKLHQRIMEGTHYSLLMNLQRNASNYEKLLNLYKLNSHSRPIREQIAQVLEPFANGEYFNTIFVLLEKDEYSKIRCIACRIAYNNQRKDLLPQFQYDSDGHIRKAAVSYLKMLEK